jgi:hypothetical protein
LFKINNVISSIIPAAAASGYALTVKNFCPPMVFDMQVQIPAEQK